MEIKEASEEQLDRLVDIWLAASLKAHGFIEPNYWQDNRGTMRGLYLPLAENYVLVDREYVLGFLSLMGDELAALFIDPIEQYKGYGSMLLTYAKEKRAALSLNVYEKNKVAIAFYQQHDFKVTGRMWDEVVGERELRLKWQKERVE